MPIDNFYFLLYYVFAILLISLLNLIGGIYTKEIIITPGKIEEIAIKDEFLLANMIANGMASLHASAPQQKIDAEIIWSDPEGNEHLVAIENLAQMLDLVDKLNRMLFAKDYVKAKLRYQIELLQEERKKYLGKEPEMHKRQI